MTKPKITGLNTIYLPATGAARSPAQDKLMMVLHGLGDSVEGYRFLPQFLNLPGLSYLLVNAPDSYYMGYSWFPFPGDSEAGILRSRKLLRSVFEQLIEQGYQAKNIGLFGFSQGAIMSMDFALRAPERIACVAAVSGFVPFIHEYPAALSAVAKEQRIFASHGDQDPVLPIEVNRPTVEALQSMGVPVEWREYAKEHTIEPEEERRDLHFFLKKAFGI